MSDDGESGMRRMGVMNLRNWTVEAHTVFGHGVHRNLNGLWKSTAPEK
jgi:hypothetical protein